jgi:pilus assembly protein CpaE
MRRSRIAAVSTSEQFQDLVNGIWGATTDDVDWLPSLATAQRAVEEGEAPNVIVLGPAVREEEASAFAQFATREAPSMAVIVVRDEPVDGAFPRLVRSGVRDVVDLTRGSSDLREVLGRAIDWSSGVRGVSTRDEDEGDRLRGAIVSVFSTKGGTGKTFLSCNLAAALAERSASKVALVDLDHDLGDVFAYFGTTPTRPLDELLALEDGADAEDVTQLGTALVGNVTGYGSPPDPQAPPIANSSISRMLRILREAFPFTVIDAGAEYSDHILTALELSDAICLISGLDAIGVRHLTLAMHTLERVGIPRDRFRIVLNRANSKVDLGVEDVERLLGVRVDARIPSSALVPRSVNRARLLWAEERRSDVAKAIQALADRLRSDLTREPVEASSDARRRLWKRG